MNHHVYLVSATLTPNTYRSGANRLSGRVFFPWIRGVKPLVSILCCCSLIMGLSAQNIGIGTSSPEYLLDVQTMEELPTLCRFKSGGAFSNILIESMDHNMSVGMNYAEAFLSTLSPLDLNLRTNDISALMIKTNTRFIGLNYTLPEHRLHAFDLANRTIARFQNLGGYSDIQVDNAMQKMLLGVNGSGGYAGTKSLHDLHLITGEVPRLSILHNSGNVGIATTTPAHRLDVYAGNTSNIARFKSDSHTGNLILESFLGQMKLSSNPSAAIIEAHSPQDLILAMNNFAALSIKNNTHYVGINQPSPDHMLHVLNASGAVARFQSISNTSTLMVDAGTKQTLVGIDPTGGYAGTSSPDDFYLMTHQSRRLTIQHATGNVGIATETPQATLDVDGSLRTRYSGTQVITPFNTTGVQTVTITIPEVPAGWNFQNTVILASNADGGAVFTINQTKLTSLTTIDLICNVTTTGLARINWVILKL